MLGWSFLMGKIWDKDILSPNDAIAEANLNLRAVFKQAYAQGAQVSIPRQWLAMTHPNFEGPQGKVELSVDLLTEAEARQAPGLCPLLSFYTLLLFVSLLCLCGTSLRKKLVFLRW